LRSAWDQKGPQKNTTVGDVEESSRVVGLQVVYTAINKGTS